MPLRRPAAWARRPGEFPPHTQACCGPCNLGPQTEGVSSRPQRKPLSWHPLTIIQDFERRPMDAITAKRRVPEFAPGDTVKVMVKVIEGVGGRQGQEEGRGGQEG